MNGGRVDGLTDIETPHVLKAPPIVATSKYPRHVVREGNRVRENCGSGPRPRLEPCSSTSRFHGRWRRPDILHIREAGNRTEAQVAAGRARVCGGTWQRRRVGLQRAMLSSRCELGGGA